MKRITALFALAAPFLSASALAQETPRKAFELLVGCAAAYANQHPSTRLTASELAEAAVASCDAYANRVRELSFLQGMGAVERLTPVQREALGSEGRQMAQANAEKIRADAITKAKKEVLQAIAESK